MIQTKIKVVYFTGSRADYAPMLPILKKLNRLSKVELSVVTAHMHLDKRFGLTVNQVQTDGLKIIGEIKTKITRSKEGMLPVYSEIINRLPQILLGQNPNYLLIQGDRVESLAATTVAFILKIPVIHVGGGAVTGSLDNGFRNAITQLSSWHFPATQKHATQIANMGKSEKTIMTVGEPGLDVIRTQKLPTKQQLWKKFNLSLNQKLFLIIMHPDTAETVSPQDQIKPLLTALEPVKAQIVQVYPNADPGGWKMRQIINKFTKNKSNWLLIDNFPHQDILGFFKYAQIILGNSSGAIIEAPSFKTPVINIGSRQKGREMARNIININYDHQSIIAAVQLAQTKKFKYQIQNCINLYGNGRAAEKFIRYFNKNLIT